MNSKSFPRCSRFDLQSNMPNILLRTGRRNGGWRLTPLALAAIALQAVRQIFVAAGRRRGRAVLCVILLIDLSYGRRTRCVGRNFVNPTFTIPQPRADLSGGLASGTTVTRISVYARSSSGFQRCHQSAQRAISWVQDLTSGDISLNNIILTNPKQNGGCSGMLIDLDLAVSVGEDGKNETSEERNMTGTLEYMAIQTLEGAIRKETAGTDHTYQHDLEAFFYVFLSLCSRYGWPSDIGPRTDPLRTWYQGSFENIATTKRGGLEPDGFEIYVLGHFSPTFQDQKGLARNLRNILFGKGALYVKLPEKPATLYDPIIKVFEDAIREVRW